MTLPLPDISHAYVDPKSGMASKAFYNWARSLQDGSGGTSSNRYPVNVLLPPYNAKGDGSTDDTLAIQAANDFAASFGGSLYIPATLNGYRVTNTINITCRHVFGDASYYDSSAPGTIIFWDPTSPSDLAVCFSCDGANGAIVEDITIEGDTSYSVATLASSGTVTAANLPNYNAFASGLAAFGTTGLGKVTFSRCVSRNAKVGLLLQGDSGHAFANGCSFGPGCLFGVYCKINSQDYTFFQTDFTGCCWAGILWGTTFFGGHNGGITASLIKSHFGFGPYAFYQCNDSGISASNAGGYSLQMYDVHFEAIGESIIKVLDSDVGASIFAIHEPPGFSWNTSTFALPDAIIAAGSKQEFIMDLGNIAVLKLSYYTVSGGGNFEISSINANAKAARIYTDGTDRGSCDHTVLLSAGTVLIENQNENTDDLRFFPHIDYVHRQEKATNSGVLQTPNMLLNPEIPANWNVSNNVVTLSTYSALVAGALSAATFPRQFFEELGSNPNCVVCTPSNVSWNARLDFAPKPTDAARHYPAMSFWVVKAGSDFNYRSRLSCQLGILVYDTTQSFGSTAQKVWGVGQRSADQPGGNTNYLEFQFFGSASTDSVYLFGMMVSLDDLAQYNPTQGPSLIGTPFLQSQTTAGSATAGAATALPATPLGYLQVNLAGTNVKIPYYTV